jgi:hypothetical protein
MYLVLGRVALLWGVALLRGVAGGTISRRGITLRRVALLGWVSLGRIALRGISLLGRITLWGVALLRIGRLPVLTGRHVVNDDHLRLGRRGRRVFRVGVSGWSIGVVRRHRLSANGLAVGGLVVDLMRNLRS